MMQQTELPGELILQAELSGHTDRVWHVAWSPAEPLLASCSTDKSVRMHSFMPVSADPVFDDADGSPPTSTTALPYRFHFKSCIPASHTRTVRSLAFSPTGKTLATASFDATVGIWTHACEAGIDDEQGLRSQPFSGSAEWEWEAVDPLEGHESECKSVAWSADGRLLASCSRDKSVWVWEAVGQAEFECLAVLMEHAQDVKMVTWHPKDELLASASYDDTIKLYAADPYDDEWACTHTLQGHTGTVWSVSFSPCGNFLSSAGDDLSIKIWRRDATDSASLKQGQPVAIRQEGGRMGPWSSSGVRIGMKERWKWSLAGEIPRAHERTIYSVDWAYGGIPENQGGLGRILSAGADGTVNVFQILSAVEDSSAPSASLVATCYDAHGVSDINHAGWCRLSPHQAAKRLRNLDGGDEDGSVNEEPVESMQEDQQWHQTKDLFATAGDDGLVKVFSIRMR